MFNLDHLLISHSHVDIKLRVAISLMTGGQADNTKLNLMTEHGRWCIDAEGISAICFSPPVRMGIGHTL